MNVRPIISIYGLTPEHTWYNRGGARITKTATPAGALTDLSFWLSPNVSYVDKDTTVVFPSSPVGGTQEDLTAAIKAAGYRSEVTRGGWFTCWRTDGQRIHLCVLDWVPDTDPMVGGQPPMDRVVRVLADWQDRAGTPYRHSPGVAAHDWIRALPRRRPITYHPYKKSGVLGGWEPPTEIRPFLWDAKFTEGRPVHALKWDTRSAYLRAMSAAELPYGPLQPTANGPAGAGYLRVKIQRHSIDAGSLLRIGTMLGLTPDDHGCYWIGTATADVLTRAGCWLEVIDSWTAPAGRLLRTWAEQVATLPDKLRKPVYAEAFGMFGSRTGSIQRRDWYHLIIDQANATLLRRIIHVHTNTGLWPVAAHRADAVLYAVDLEREPEFSALLGNGMRFEGEI